MKYPPNVWDQLKNLTADQLVHALKKDGWVKDESSGAIHIYRHPDGRRASIHYHPHKTYGPKLLKNLLDDINWSEKEMRNVKLIK